MLITCWQTSFGHSLQHTRVDLGGGCRGAQPPPPPRDDPRLSNTTGILQKTKMRFIGVKVEQEKFFSGATPPKQNPGSDPEHSCCKFLKSIKFEGKSCPCEGFCIVRLWHSMFWIVFFFRKCETQQTYKLWSNFTDGRRDTYHTVTKFVITCSLVLNPWLNSSGINNIQI